MGARDFGYYERQVCAAEEYQARMCPPGRMRVRRCRLSGAYLPRGSPDMAADSTRNGREWTSTPSFASARFNMGLNLLITAAGFSQNVVYSSRSFSPCRRAGITNPGGIGGYEQWRRSWGGGVFSGYADTWVADACEISRLMATISNPEIDKGPDAASKFAKGASSR